MRHRYVTVILDMTACLRRIAAGSEIILLMLCCVAAYHTGDSPDERTLDTLEAHGIDDYDHMARRVRPPGPLFFFLSN